MYALKKTVAVLFVTAVTAGLFGAPPASAAITTRTYSGVGDDVIMVNLAENGLIKASGSGDGNFAIWTLKRSGAKKELLVNEIGAYRGIVAFEAGPASQRVGAIQVEAEGSWTITVRPLVSARNWKLATASGAGDNVLQIFNRKLTLKATYRGDSNFVIWALDGSGRKIDLLVNTIGDYSGRTVLPSGARYVVINAGVGDPWTVTKR